jgi:Ca-activated chloride channel family protein
VILISDGQANVGITDEQLIGDHADDEEGQEGIYLAGIGVGDGVNDTLMNVVTDAGRGAYVYLDSVDEADKILGKRLLSVVDVAARAVRLEVTLPWYMQVQKFYGEQISTDPTKVRPQHLGPNDAMLFFQVLRACDGSLIHGDDRIRLRATWEAPFTREAREAVVDTTFNALAGDDANLTKAAAIAGYAEALVRVDGMVDVMSRKQVLESARKNVLQAKGAQTDPDLIEIADLLATYAK